MVYVQMEEPEANEVSQMNVRPPIDSAMVAPSVNLISDGNSVIVERADAGDIIDSVFGGLTITEEPKLPQPKSTAIETLHEEVVGGSPTLVGYFSGRTEPCPRINPCLMIRGNSLFIYGGLVEIGDVEVALDDCWALDLNKRDRWRQLLQGTMDMMVWQGGDDEATEGTGMVSKFQRVTMIICYVQGSSVIMKVLTTMKLNRMMRKWTSQS